MKPIIALALLSLTSAAKDCWVGDWTEWSECEVTTGCNAFQDYNPESWKLAAAESDSARLRMNEMMRLKQKYMNHRKKCMAEGTCPEMAIPPSSGYTKCVDNYSGEYPCKNLDQLSFISLEDMAGEYAIDSGGNDVWGWVDPETEEEIAIMGISKGTAFVNVKNPRNPRPVAFMPSHMGSRSLWRDMKVIENHVYVVSEAANHGLQIFDLTRLRNMTGDLEFVEPDAHYAGFGQAHNVVANEETNFIYGVGSRVTGEGVTVCRGGLHVVDVSIPTQPHFRGCFGEDGYTHDAQCVIYRGPDQDHVGREVCFAYNEDSLTIVDVTDKDNMSIISKQEYEGVQYTHQGWLTEDQRALLLDDELDEFYGTDKRTRTFFWNIENLDAPVLETVYIAETTAIDHNQYTHKGRVYQSNYEAGLRVLDIDQESFELKEVAYFDVYPSRMVALYQHGTWSNYPYFPSGTILLSSMDYGLFILELDVEGAEETGKQSRRRHVQGNDCPHTSESRPCSNVC